MTEPHVGGGACAPSPRQATPAGARLLALGGDRPRAARAESWYVVPPRFAVSSRVI